MPELVIPSNIPWKELKNDMLEEFVFWLLNDMGAKDIEWRKGGEKTTTSDGGRDIETSFHMPTPDGEIEKQKWWIEIKGRSGTLEKTAVQEAVYNAYGRNNIDTLVIVTNTQFSNPTRDWVTQFQNEHPRPKIRLWDRNSLERMIIKHPSVVVRVCPEALSDQGRLEALTSRFWNQLYFPAHDDLVFFWNKRYEVEWTCESLIMVIAGDLVNGDVAERSWMADLESDEETLYEILVTVIANSVQLWLRGEDYGVNSDHIINLVSFIIMNSLLFMSFELAVSVIEEPWNFFEDGSSRKSSIEHFLKHVLWRIDAELGDACLHDCSRVNTDPILLGVPSDEVKNYWKRFSKIEYNPDNSKKSTRLVFEAADEPCNAGLELNVENQCPLWRNKDLSLREKLSNYKIIISNRVQQEVEKHK